MCELMQRSLRLVLIKIPDFALYSRFHALTEHSDYTRILVTQKILNNKETKEHSYFTKLPNSLFIFEGKIVPMGYLYIISQISLRKLNGFFGKSFGF